MNNELLEAEENGGEKQATDAGFEYLSAKAKKLFLDDTSAIISGGGVHESTETLPVEARDIYAGIDAIADRFFRSTERLTSPLVDKIESSAPFIEEKIEDIVESSKDIGMKTIIKGAEAGEVAAEHLVKIGEYLNRPEVRGATFVAAWTLAKILVFKTGSMDPSSEASMNAFLVANSNDIDQFLDDLIRFDIDARNMTIFPKQLATLYEEKTIQLAERLQDGLINFMRSDASGIPIS